MLFLKCCKNVNDLHQALSYCYVSNTCPLVCCIRLASVLTLDKFLFSFPICIRLICHAHDFYLNKCPYVLCKERRLRSEYQQDLWQNVRNDRMSESCMSAHPFVVVWYLIHLTADQCITWAQGVMCRAFWASKSWILCNITTYFTFVCIINVAVIADLFFRQVSWTHALRTIVLDCYRHHGRDDLLPEFHETDQSQAQHAAAGVPFPHHTMVQTINNPDGTVSIIQIDTGETGAPQMVTLADGTQAQIVHTVSVGWTSEMCVCALKWVLYHMYRYFAFEVCICT